MPTLAQTSGVSVAGRVKDQNSALVAGATVVLRQRQTTYERVATTDDAGAFSFENLSQGEYVLTASGGGFSPAEQLVRVAGARSEVEFVLHPATLAESAVVTVGRIADTPEVVERIPGTVDVISPQVLENSRVLTTSEALRKVAGVNVRDEEGFGLRPNIGIRGLNPTRSTKVLLLEDGVPFTYAPYGDNASYYHPPIDRFESVEVLKGSGQILYGPQTVGGVINYVTRTPPEDFSGFVTLTGGSRDYFNGHLNAGGTWKNTGLLFDLTRKQGEGARDQHRSGLIDLNFKSVTTLTARQALTTKFNHYRERSQVSYSGLTEAEFAAGARQNPFFNDRFYGDRFGGSATHAVVLGQSAVLTTTLYGNYFRRHWWRQSSNSGQRPNRLNVDADCRSMADLNTTCGNEGRLRKYYFVGVEPRVHVTHRLLNAPSELDFGFRAHFETQDRRQLNGDQPNSRTGIVAENNERRNRAYSGFVQNRVTVGDFTITPGLRVEHINFERTSRPTATFASTVRGAYDLTQVVPGLGVAYNPVARLTVFAGVHRGFAPPRTEDIINNTTGGVVDLDPELSWNYEVGVRTSPADGLRLEAAFFRMDYANQIVAASLAGGVGSTLTNAGSTLHQGFEFTGRLDTGALLKQPHNFYARAAYTFLPTAEFTGLRRSSVAGFTNVLITGNRLPYAPEHTLTASAGYAHPRGFDGFLEAVHVSRQFGDDLNLLTTRPDGQVGPVPAYTVWNATANYTAERLRTTFFVTVKNLFDDLYIVDRARGILPSSPRLVQGGLKYRFGR